MGKVGNIWKNVNFWKGIWNVNLHFGTAHAVQGLTFRMSVSEDILTDSLISQQITLLWSPLLLHKHQDHFRWWCQSIRLLYPRVRSNYSKFLKVPLYFQIIYRYTRRLPCAFYHSTAVRLGFYQCKGGIRSLCSTFELIFPIRLSLIFFFCLVAFGTNFVRCDTLSNIRSLLD